MLPYIVPGKPEVDFRITQRFDTKVTYTKSKTHGGLDIAPAKPGTRGVVLYAPHEGYVGVSSFGDLGNHIRVTSLPYKKEGDTRETLIAHCEKFLVKDGEYVAQGTPIAIMGGAPGMPGAGRSTGIHAHWEYRVNGKLMDVEPYLFTWSLKS